MTSDELAALAASMPFAKLIGFQVIEAGKDKVVAQATVRDDLCTAGDIAHGGFLNLPDGAKTTTTPESKTNLIAAAPAGSVLTATATPVSIGRRLQVWQTRIEREGGKLVALTTQSQMNL